MFRPGWKARCDASTRVVGFEECNTVVPKKRAPSGRRNAPAPLSVCLPACLPACQPACQPAACLPACLPACLLPLCLPQNRAPRGCRGSARTRRRRWRSQWRSQFHSTKTRHRILAASRTPLRVEDPPLAPPIVPDHRRVCCAVVDRLQLVVGRSDDGRGQSEAENEDRDRDRDRDRAGESRRGGGDNWKERASVAFSEARSERASVTILLTSCQSGAGNASGRRVAPVREPTSSSRRGAFAPWAEGPFATEEFSVRAGGGCLSLCCCCPLTVLCLAATRALLSSSPRPPPSCRRAPAFPPPSLPLPCSSRLRA